MAEKNNIKTGFLFKYNMSANALDRLFKKKELTRLSEPGDEEKLRLAIAHALPKNNPTFLSSIINTRHTICVIL